MLCLVTNLIAHHFIHVKSFTKYLFYILCEKMKKSLVISCLLFLLVSCNKEQINSSNQILENLNSSSTQMRTSTLEKGLIAHYTFDGNYLDRSSSANHGMNNGTTFVKDRKGKLRRAITLNGNSSYVALTKPFFEGTLVTQLTYSVWFKVPVYPGPGNQFTISDKQGYWREVNLTLGSNGDMAFWWTFPNPQAYYGHYSNENIVPLNKWNHYAVTMNGQTINAYLNGKLISARHLSTNGQIDFSYLQLGNSTNTNLIGATSTVSPGLLYFFKGELDDFRIYNRPLSSSEITNLFNN